MQTTIVLRCKIFNKLLPFLLLFASLQGQVTLTELVENSTGTNASEFTTASITPSPNKLIVLAIRSLNAAASQPTDPTVAGNSLTWVEAICFDSHTNLSQKLCIFRAMGSPTAGTVVITFAEDQNSIAWWIGEFDNVITTGSNGADAIVQAPVSNTSSTSSLTVTLSAFSSNNNATFGVFHGNVGNFHTPGSGFIELHDVGGSLTWGGAVYWKNSNDTSVDNTLAAATLMAGVAIEIGWALTTGNKAMIGSVF